MTMFELTDITALKPGKVLSEHGQGRHCAFLCEGR